MNRHSTPIVIILLSVLILTGLGLVMISSTTAPFADSSGQLKKQLIWFLGSLVIFAVLGWVDYKTWRSWVWIAFGVSLVLLALVFVPHLGSRVKGASRWLNLFGFKIQPSEFLRLTLVFLLAHILSKHQSKIREWKWGFIWPLGIIVIPLILLRLEPDLGTMLLVIATTFVMMFVAGARVWPVIGAGTLMSIGFAAMMWMLPERRARVMAFLNPEQHKEGKFFQIWQGILAFGSGGTHGLGLGNSRQKMFYLPESTTDSIFPIIGEELGLYVTLAVILAYIAILVCGLWISVNSRESFGNLLGFGLVFGLTLQALINIGTVTGSIPPKGMPLPFVSYGGSNLLISYIAIAVLVSIHRQSLRANKFSGGMPLDEETPAL
jgi:cell division protein FtsW